MLDYLIERVDNVRLRFFEMIGSSIDCILGGSKAQFSDASLNSLDEVLSSESKYVLLRQKYEKAWQSYDNSKGHIVGFAKGVAVSVPLVLAEGLPDGARLFIQCVYAVGGTYLIGSAVRDSRKKGKVAEVALNDLIAYAVSANHLVVFDDFEVKCPVSEKYYFWMLNIIIKEIEK